jgi:fructose-bisphosphate aldolase class II
MGLVLNRNNVLDIYSEAEEKGWVLPAFNSENLTTCEAILSGAAEYGKQIGEINLPIIVGITNNYPHRPQSRFYTQTRNWELGMKLFLDDMKQLASAGSPFENLRIMIHLDHILWDEDRELLDWNMNQFSSIMFDASELSLNENIEKTADFVNKYQNKILIEGICDEIGKISSDTEVKISTSEMVERYFRETNVDIIVANLGTEHRAGSASLNYHGHLARDITTRIGSRLCLHGTSSISNDYLHKLYDDGIRKVNIWTALERDSVPFLLQELVDNAAKVAGANKVKTLIHSGFLGEKVDSTSEPSLDFFTTTYRQDIIFKRMKDIVINFLKIWYK